MEITVWAWLGFGLFVGGLLALDLGVLHRKEREIKVGEALWLSLLYLVLALLSRPAFSGPEARRPGSSS